MRREAGHLRDDLLSLFTVHGQTTLRGHGEQSLDTDVTEGPVLADMICHEGPVEHPCKPLPNRRARAEYLFELGLDRVQGKQRLVDVESDQFGAVHGTRLRDQVVGRVLTIAAKAP